MNKEDAKKVIKLLLTVDGGCKYCVNDVLKEFQDTFPEIDISKIMKTSFKEFQSECEHEYISKDKIYRCSLCGFEACILYNGLK